MSALASTEGLEVVGNHDSGLMVRAPKAVERDVLTASRDSFQMDGDGAKPEFTRYNYQSMEQKLRDLAARYPELATLQAYGTSRQGRNEYVLTVGHGEDPKPELMITGATHGNETITVDVVLGLVEQLLAGYGTDQRLTTMLEDHTIHFIPAVCVDSYVARQRQTEGRDPNRDYPWPETPSRTPVGCIRDVMGFFDAKPIVGTMDIHAAASMIMFPWAWTYDDIPAADFRKMDELTTHMAQANGFEHGAIASTIYVAKGSSADYYYWKKGAIATAIEVSHNKAAQGLHAIDPIVVENTESTWRFIESF